jgi:hypothetical protein
LARVKRRSFSLVVVGVSLLLAAACSKRNDGPELTCKVNGVCFVCPNAVAQANCIRDPSTSRCKYAEPSHCK